MTEPKKHLMVVEDDPGLQSQLRWSFSDYEVLIAGNREDALAQLRRHEPPVITLDLGLPPDADGASEGLATLEQILSLAPDAKVIVVTGNSDHENAVKAIGLGAYDFYQKPIAPEILALIVNRAYHVYALETENRKLTKHKIGSPLPGLIAASAQMTKVCRTIERIASTNATTLLLGESGTGKELLARALHDLSARAKKRFVAINCAAIPETLLESELFGYEKGAFTGAHKQTIGKIESADAGTLFLDEVGDLPMAMQVKLLRFLQERVIERVGGRKEIPVDVRVVCATHQDLPALIQDGSFREDLYYRISEISIRIPSLRERDGDAVLLARAFLESFKEQQGLNRSLRGYSKDALTAISSYPWPGNVRELENKVKRAVIMADGRHVTAEDLELDIANNEPEMLNLRAVRDQAERQALQKALTLYDSNISRTAEVLGVSRPTLYDLMNKHGIK
ncbi:MAG: two-component system NtrC family response regulator [Gammaproteobacteria bacterium]|nr:MAG: two-component system NtrC family response regulator [Gammaproteobacteria bacterium]TND05331.1 MAG: two-component system, NtrC family, response regulator [Gammaproteobacteria bacterium]